MLVLYHSLYVNGNGGYLMASIASHIVCYLISVVTGVVIMCLLGWW